MQFRRREFLQSTLAAGAGALLPLGRARAAGKFAGQTLVFATWGGAYEQTQRKAYVAPFERDTGASVTVDGPVQPARLRVMLEGGSAAWQVICVDNTVLYSFGKDKLLKKIDPTRLDLSQILPEYRHDYGVGVEAASFVLAYNTTLFPAGKTPKTWADAFDLKNFPGKRMFQKTPTKTIEIALMADGVPMDKLYPLDFDRAFKKLDTIKDSIIFFDTHSQSQQLVSDGVASCGYMYSARAYNAQQNGAKIAISWEQNIRSSTPMVLPAALPDKDLDICYAFLAETIKPENQAVLSNDFVVATSNPAALKFVKPEILPWLPTYGDNMAKGFAIDDRYWGDLLAPVTQRFQTWLLS
jgi:putative spermidine/putrescine transport system substrate-binding protein